MTDQEVVETLARREGRSEILFVPPYLTSIDALQPVLGKLSDEEQGNLVDWLCHHAETEDGFAFEWYLLTIPPTTLARAIAEVLASTAPK